MDTVLIVDLEADLQYANTWLYVSLCPVLLFFLLQLLPVFTFDLWHGWSCVTWGRQQVGRTQVAEVLGYLVHEVLKFPNIPCKILKSFIVLNIIFHNKKKQLVSANILWICFYSVWIPEIYDKNTCIIFSENFSFYVFIIQMLQLICRKMHFKYVIFTNVHVYIWLNYCSESKQSCKWI